VHKLIRYLTLREVQLVVFIPHCGACLSMESQYFHIEARNSLVLPERILQICSSVSMNLVPIESSSPCEGSSYKSFGSLVDACIPLVTEKAKEFDMAY